MARPIEKSFPRIAACLALAAAGCATSQPLRESGRAGEHQISCGYFGWYICYERADQLCGGRYKVLSETEDAGRKLRVACEDSK